MNAASERLRDSRRGINTQPLSQVRFHLIPTTLQHPLHPQDQLKDAPAQPVSIPSQTPTNGPMGSVSPPTASGNEAASGTGRPGAAMPGMPLPMGYPGQLYGGSPQAGMGHMYPGHPYGMYGAPYYGMYAPHQYTAQQQQQLDGGPGTVARVLKIKRRCHVSAHSAALLAAAWDAAAGPQCAVVQPGDAVCRSAPWGPRLHDGHPDGRVHGHGARVWWARVWRQSEGGAWAQWPWWLRRPTPGACWGVCVCVCVWGCMLTCRNTRCAEPLRVDISSSPQDEWRPSSRGRSGPARAGSNNSYHGAPTCVFLPVAHNVYSKNFIFLWPTDDGSPAGQLLAQIRNGQWAGTLGELRAEVLRVCKDQNGSRVIQQKMDHAPREEVEALFDDLTDQQKQELVVDTFGNYVVQKFLDLAGVEAQDKVLVVLRGNMVTHSCDQYGCRVVQKALQVGRVGAEWGCGVLCGG